MKSKTKIITTGFFLVIMMCFLQSCQKMPPDCNNDSTKENVLRLYMEVVGKNSYKKVFFHTGAVHNRLDELGTYKYTNGVLQGYARANLGVFDSNRDRELGKIEEKIFLNTIKTESVQKDAKKIVCMAELCAERIFENKTKQLNNIPVAYISRIVISDNQERYYVEIEPDYLGLLKSVKFFE